MPAAEPTKPYLLWVHVQRTHSNITVAHALDIDVVSQANPDHADPEASAIRSLWEAILMLMDDGEGLGIFARAPAPQPYWDHMWMNLRHGAAGVVLVYEIIPTEGRPWKDAQIELRMRSGPQRI